MSSKSILAYLPVNLANIFISFGTIMILTRLLSGAEFGVYALAVITVEFVHLGLFSWIESAMERFWARADRNNNINNFIKSLFSFCLIYGLIVVGTVLAILYLLPVNTHVKTVLAFALGALSLRNLSCLFLESHLAATRSLRYSTVYTMITMGGFVIGIVLILLTPLRESAPFIGILIALSVSMFFEVPFMLKLMKGGGYQSQYMKQAFRYGMPISIALMLTYTLNSADVYFIAHFMGWESVGQYNAGYNLANRSLDVLFVWISMALTPIIIQAVEKESTKNALAIVKSCGAGMLWIALPMATGIALVAEPAGIILGESVRAGAITIMPYIAFAAVMSGMLTYYAQKAFMISERTDVFVWVLIAPVAVNLILNVLFIPQYGLIGAVIATCVAYALGLILAIVIGRRYYPLPIPVKAFFQIGLSCLVMSIVVHNLPVPKTWPDIFHLIIKGGVGASVYGSVSWLINSGGCRSYIKEYFRNKADADAAYN